LRRWTTLTIQLGLRIGLWLSGLGYKYLTTIVESVSTMQCEWCI